MAADRKRSWVRPESRPVTDADSRADVPDAPVQNVIAVSDAP